MTCLDCLGERVFIRRETAHGDGNDVGSVERVYLCWDCGEVTEELELTAVEWPIEREPVQ